MNAEPVATPGRRPSLAPYLVRPEEVRMAEQAYRAAFELEAAVRRYEEHRSARAGGAA